MPEVKKQMVFSKAKKTEGKSLDEKILPWKILVVDDEPIIHSVTELVLRDITFENRPMKLFSAYGETDAQKILENEKDIAVALIDVVMEHDNSGLNLIRWIREVLKNTTIRLILRTGQPGVAPEKEIIHRYEINDYKEKTELTDIKLLTSLTVAIRGYRDLVDIQKNQSGFARILNGAQAFWQNQSESALMTEILTQFSTLFSVTAGQPEVRDCFSVIQNSVNYAIHEGTGDFLSSAGSTLSGIGLAGMKEAMAKCCHRTPYFYEAPYLVCSLDTRQTSGLYLVTKCPVEPDDTDYNILGAFLVNSSLAMDYWLLTASKSRSQRNMLIFLSEVIEHHFMENGNHIRRVSEMMYLVSRKTGIEEEKAERWKMASILHDMGKIGIPDHILKKPGKLTPQEFEIMKSHVLIGHKLLSSNKDEFFPDAADIALSHHEKWNGAGYPYGLTGEDIPLPARILSIIDVFDALTHTRVYKDAWTVRDALDYIQEKKGTDFDPELVDSFIAIVPELQWVLDEYPD